MSTDVEMKNFVIESNRIEGITRPPTYDHMREFRAFLALDGLTIGDLVVFVNVFQPNARLRSKAGMDVTVAGKLMPPGGEFLVRTLEGMVDEINLCQGSGFSADAYQVHQEFEHLHPFTDCNGRLGRAIWAWEMKDLSLGFLHRFYYQSLAAWED